MITTFQFPEVRHASFRAVSYGAQDVRVYDDAVDERKVVWIENHFEEAQLFMEAVTEYLVACKAHKDQPGRETSNRMASCFLSLPSHTQKAVLDIAKARGLVE